MGFVYRGVVMSLTKSGGLALVLACAVIVVVAPAGAGAKGQEKGARGAEVSYPSHVNFGRVAKGEESTREVTFTNVGEAMVTLGPLGIFALEGEGFGMESDNCSGEIADLAPGQSCTYVIRFAADMASGRNRETSVAELRFSTSAGESSVKLKGVATAR